VTSKKEGNANYILIPKAGRYYGSGNYQADCAVVMSGTRRSNSEYYDFYNGSMEDQNYNYKYKGVPVRAVYNVTDVIANTQVYVHTSGCQWTIGGQTATLSGVVSSSAPMTDVSYGFVVGSIDEISAATPSVANLVTAGNLDADGRYSTVVSYDGGAKFFRAFACINGQYSFGEIRSITAADLLDVVFLPDGSAINGTFSGVKGKKNGSPTVAFNTEYNRYETSLPGNAFGSGSSNTAPNNYSFYYEASSDFRNKLYDGHTLEVLAKLPASPTNNNEGYAFSSFNSGGSGIGVKNKVILSTINLTSGGWNYVYTDVTPMGDMYHHMVFVYDKVAGKLRVYVDGVLRKEQNCSGNFNHPNGYSYNVGAEPYNNFALGWNGSVAIARVYDETLTTEQVETLYNHLK
jgi:hypothetical protein